MFRGGFTKIMRLGIRQMNTGAMEGPPVARSEKCVNMTMLLGRVGRDAEMRGTEQHPVVLFSLATNVNWIGAEGSRQSKTEWHKITVFRPGLRENVAVNIRKGDRVHVTGSINYSEYTDSQGVVKQATSIIADDIVNLTKRYLEEGAVGGEESMN